MTISDGHVLRCVTGENVSRRVLSRFLSSCSNLSPLCRVEQFADYGAAAKVAQSEKYFNLLGFKRPLSGMLVGPAQPRRLPPTTVATEIHSIGVTKTNDNNHRFGLDSTGNNRNLREERIDKRDSLSSGLSASKAQVASSSPFGKEDLLRSPMVPSIPEEP